LKKPTSFRPDHERACLDHKIAIHKVEITSKYRNDRVTPMFCFRAVMEKQMLKLGILGATALSLAIAVATPALAEGRGGGGRMHVGGGGGMHLGGRGGGMQVAGGGFRSSQASVGAGRVGGRFAQGGYRGGYGRGVGFGAGLAVGSALGYGGYGGYYDPYNYSDDYAYNDLGYDGYSGYNGYPGYMVSSGGDPSYCAQRYQSYDPASGTYLGYDGLRHPCS
jgi:hypothetical protein